MPAGAESVQNDDMVAIQERMMEYAVASRRDIITTGFTNGRGSGSGRSMDWQAITRTETGYFSLGLPPAKFNFPRLARTAILFSLESADEKYGIGFDGTLNFDTDILVIDNSFKSPLTAKAEIHVPLSLHYTRECEIENVLFEMSGGYPANMSDDFLNLDWREATEQDIHSFDDIIAGVMQRKIDSGYRPGSGKPYFQYR